MPNTDQPEGEALRTNSGMKDDRSESISDENCGVQTKTELSLVQTNYAEARHDDILADLTAAEYRTLQDAYDWFNLGLFNGELPQVLITLQRHHRALGYFSPKRFQSRGRALKNVHEVALNPDAFYGNSDKAILSILAHEMVHVWQEEYGHPGRNRYHNREWAGKMCMIVSCRVPRVGPAARSPAKACRTTSWAARSSTPSATSSSISAGSHGNPLR